MTLSIFCILHYLQHLIIINQLITFTVSDFYLVIQRNIRNTYTADFLCLCTYSIFYSLTPLTRIVWNNRPPILISKGQSGCSKLSLTISLLTYLLEQNKILAVEIFGDIFHGYIWLGLPIYWMTPLKVWCGVEAKSIILISLMS